MCGIERIFEFFLIKQMLDNPLLAALKLRILDFDTCIDPDDKVVGIKTQSEA